MQTANEIQQSIRCSSFFTASGAYEYYLTATSRENISFSEALEEFTYQYNSALFEHDLSKYTLQFTRIYLSDITNDLPFLMESDLLEFLSNGAVSFVQQSPLCGGPIAILSYHIKSQDHSFRQQHHETKKSFSNQSVKTNGKNYSLLWTTNFTGLGDLNSEKQTQGVLSSFGAALKEHEMTLRNNTVRTWIYVRDIDNHYAGMVKARRELFDKSGLTSKTRYIASTGIEGKSADPHSLLTIDALSIGNIKEEQIVRMEALNNLSSTSVYGVTFERGTRLLFGDRSHIHISGTASIDSLGNTLYQGDIKRQLTRTIDNIEALLEPHGATIEDMRYLILYLRNPKHYPLITNILSQRIPETVPLIAVEASVCRPAWLVEIEGVGIINDSNDFPPFA